MTSEAFETLYSTVVGGIRFTALLFRETERKEEKKCPSVTSLD